MTLEDHSSQVRRGFAALNTGTVVIAGRHAPKCVSLSGGDSLPITLRSVRCQQATSRAEEVGAPTMTQEKQQRSDLTLPSTACCSRNRRDDRCGSPGRRAMVMNRPDTCPDWHPCG